VADSEWQIGMAARCCTMLIMEAIGMRRLRLELPRLLERVRRGEALEITDRGVPVARLMPLPARAGILDTMIAGREAEPSTRATYPLPEPVRAGAGLTRALLELRAESDR
jgi:prevent-host-death family protein